MRHNQHFDVQLKTKFICIKIQHFIRKYYLEEILLGISFRKFIKCQFLNLSIFLYLIKIKSLSQVSATFAASLITSPALGAYLGTVYSDSVVVALATAISLLDILFILVCVPESLPERLRPVSWGKSIPWEKADPFSASVCFQIIFYCYTRFNIIYTFKRSLSK